MLVVESLECLGHFGLEFGVLNISIYSLELSCFGFRVFSTFRVWVVQVLGSWAI